MNDAGYEILTRSVYFLPRFLEHPKDILTDVNEGIALTVEVEGSPYPDIQWQKQVDGMFENLTNENETSLQFESVDYSDAGVYRSVISLFANGTFYSVTSEEAIISGNFDQ